MVPSGYLVVAGLLAGLAALRSLVVNYLAAWFDVSATTVATYGLVAGWLGFLLVPVCAAGVGYAGGSAADGPPELARSGVACLGIGLLASVAAVGVALVVQPSSVSYQSLLYQTAGFALNVARAVTTAAVAFVAGAAVATE